MFDTAGKQRGGRADSRASECAQSSWARHRRDSIIDLSRERCFVRHVRRTTGYGGTTRTTHGVAAVAQGGCRRTCLATVRPAHRTSRTAHGVGRVHRVRKDNVVRTDNFVRKESRDSEITRHCAKRVACMPPGAAVYDKRQLHRRGASDRPAPTPEPRLGTGSDDGKEWGMAMDEPPGDWALQRRVVRRGGGAGGVRGSAARGGSGGGLVERGIREKNKMWPRVVSEDPGPR